MKKGKKSYIIIGILVGISLIFTISIGMIIKNYKDLEEGKREVTDINRKINIWTNVAGNSSKSKLADMNINYNSSYIISGGILYSTIANNKYIDGEKEADTYTYFHEIKNGYEKDTYEDEPYIIPYLAENSDSAVIVLPGGAYADKSMDNSDGESTEVAKVLQKNGINAFVLHYRANPYEYPIPMLDLQRAIRYIKYHSEEYGIDKNKIGLIGFSAGGNLIGIYINLIQGNDVLPENYIKDEIDFVDDSVLAPAMIYPALTFNYNVPMLFCLFDDDDVRNKEKREELLEMLDIKNHLENSKDIPQFISYGTIDILVRNGPKEYIERAKEEGIDITVKVAEGQNHSYGQKYYMKEYLNWVKNIFNNKGITQNKS